jgi:2,4-dienoyl-CoA reductase-like NADH-dependent reductase (Old Yellow Enzyme family)/thioredoxin reductase
MGGVQMADQFKLLFSPIKVGSMMVRNRIVVPGHYPAMRDPDTLPGERITAYWESKARGGAGIVCTGIWGVHRSSPTPVQSGYEFHSQQSSPLQELGGIDKLKRTAETIQKHGAKFMVQLWHGGANAYGTTAYGDQLWAPSATQADGSGYVAHSMTRDEIREVVEAFAAEAYRAKQAGVDGVEIHGAHGYLVTQFMSPLTNHRTDEYGGDNAGRIRFACEVANAIRAAVGSDFTVGMRVSVDQLSGGGYSVDDTKEMAKIVVATGSLDYLATGAGIPPTYYPLGALMYHAAALKEVVDIPVIGGGRINDPVQAEKILEDRLADLLFMNRALICDPEMPRKAQEGMLDDIRRCMGCSEGCWMRVSQDRNPQGVSCTYNPTVGKETLPGWLELIPAETRKKVVVIGGGPAGLETARVAKARGHDVSLWEKSGELGGMSSVAAKAPGRDDLNELARYYRYQMKALDVDVHLNTEVTVDLVKEQNPDVVIVATGSRPMVPADIPGMDQDNVVSNVRDVLNGDAKVGQNVLIVDVQRHIQGLATADFLAQQGKSVEVIFPLAAPGENMEQLTRMALLQRLSWAGVKLTPRTSLKEISGNGVIVTTPLTGEERAIEAIDTIILSYGGVENNELYYALKDEFPEVYVAGDANGVRKMLWAVHDGAVLGRGI